MSFDSRKGNHGERVLTVVALYPNQCKYAANLSKGNVTAGAGVTNVYTGALAISGGDAVFFTAGNPYLLWDSEIIKITVNSATQVTITARAQFGTTAVAHSAGAVRILHGGEADSSCRGFPRTPDGKGCSNGDSFDEDVTLEMLFPSMQLVDGTKYFNGLDIRSLSHTPAKVDPGNSIGSRASYSCTINETYDNDSLLNPYPALRTEGQLFRKLLARHPYMQNRKAVVYTGFVKSTNETFSFDRNECLKREFIIDKLTINRDSVSIQMADPLIFTEASKAKYPAASRGRLLAAINGSSTQITLKDFVVGEYGADSSAVTVSIDDELIDCTVNSSASGVLDIVTRAVGGSEKKDHSINATVQYTAVLTNFNPVQLIVDLWQTTGIPAAYYDDYSSAIAAVTNGTGPVYWNKPEGVDTRVNEIIKAWSANGLVVYFDERAQKLRIKASSDFSQQPLTLTYESDIYQGSINCVDDWKNQYTRATIGFAPFNAAKKTDKENASIYYQHIGLDVEVYGLLQPNEAKEFYTGLLTNSDTDVSIAVAGAAQTVNTNQRPPQIWTFDIDWSSLGAVTGGVVEEGEIINITTDERLDMDGKPVSENVQILSLKDNPAVQRVTVTAKRYQDVIVEADFDFVIDTDKTDYDLSTEFAPAAGNYKIFIASGVTIGATSTANPAFTTGSQASGVTFEITHRGSILGAGGDGNTGPSLLIPNYDDIPNYSATRDGVDGDNGGDAINLTVDCTIDTSQGVIYSGGGGSSSTGAAANNAIDLAVPSIGGCGGQGFVGGGYGLGGTTEIDGYIVEEGFDGMPGTRAAPGSVASLSGGAWGEQGTSHNNGVGGLAGYAIKSNGNAVSITGDNALTIKGRRDF